MTPQGIDLPFTFLDLVCLFVVVCLRKHYCNSVKCASLSACAPVVPKTCLSIYHIFLPGLLDVVNTAIDTSMIVSLTVFTQGRDWVG